MKKIYLFLVIPFLFSVNETFSMAAPAGDDCSNAVDLAGQTSPISSTTVGAANDFSFCTMGSAPDLIVYYDLPVGATLTIQQTVNGYDSRHSLRYSGACPGTIEIDCTDDPDTQVETWQNCTGATQRVYWIQSGFSTNSGTFTLAWSVTAGTCPVPAANDDCGSAVSLTINPDLLCGTTTSGNVIGATASSQSSTDCFGTEDDDVWFSFVATGPTHVISLLNIAGSTTDMYHSVWEGTCPGSLTLFAGTCSDPNSQTVTGLTPGNTYFVRVYTYTATGGQTSTFDVCVGTPPPPPANDECSGAIALTVNPTAVCATTTAGTVASATPSAQDPTACFGTENDDVWYSFVAIDPQHDVSLTNVAGSTTDMYHSVWEGTCPGLTLFAGSCSDGNTQTLNGLTVGNTYYVRVNTYSSTSGATSTFDICISSPCGGVSQPTCGLSYSHSTIAYNPQSYTTGTAITFGDDRFADAYTSLGFDFCYDGVIYQDVLVSSNGYITFPGCYSGHPFGTKNVLSGYSGYSISAAAPNTTNAPVNAIMGTWQDIYPSTLAADGEIRTQTTGTAPNRIFTTKFKDVRMFSCTTLDYNGQITIKETSDEIEVHLGEKTVCTTFNSGAAIMGLTDCTGSIANIPAGYNYPTQWTVATGSPEGHRWTSGCGACVLPVKLTNFTGKPHNNYNFLTWNTETEINNDYFVLEKSDGGMMFEEVGTIDGAGNSNTLLSYTFNHKNPRKLEYYRLKQVDFNGKYAYSKIITVRSLEDLEINIYPNPSKNNFSFDLSVSSNEVYAITYTNLLGSVLREQINITEGTNHYQVNEFEKLSPGIYFIQILNSSNEVVKTQKIVKK